MLPPVQPTPGTSKDLISQYAKNTPSPAQSTGERPHTATHASSFTRLRDAAENKVPRSPEYLTKVQLRKMNWRDRIFCDINMPFTGDTTLPKELRTIQTPWQFWQFFNYFSSPELAEKIRERYKTIYTRNG